jgi:hypothetical protein
MFCTLCVAHNHISGTIPSVLQEQDFTSLDLSYNKLSGEYTHTKHSHYGEDDNHTGRQELVLQVNRLSGPLSETSYTITRILDGNLFGCDFIPSEDEHSGSYACGRW